MNIALRSVEELDRAIPKLLAELVSLVPPALRAKAQEISDKAEILSGAVPAPDAPWLDLNLTFLERRMLNCLASAPGRCFTKVALLNALYFDRPGDEPEPKIIDVFICKIRGKLRNSPMAIETLWSSGYRLVERSPFQGGPMGETRKRPIGQTPRNPRVGYTWQGIRMYPTEGQIAQKLYESIGEVVPMESLLTLARSSNTLNTRITRLRSLLGGKYAVVHQPGERHRTNQPGEGYRMVEIRPK